MAKKKTVEQEKAEKVELTREPWETNPLLKRDGFGHMGQAERFLHYVYPRIGSFRAARCISIDVKKLKEEWEKLKGEGCPLPVEMDE